MPRSSPCPRASGSAPRRRCLQLGGTVSIEAQTTRGWAPRPLGSAAEAARGGGTMRCQPGRGRHEPVRVARASRYAARASPVRRRRRPARTARRIHAAAPAPEPPATASSASSSGPAATSCLPRTTRRDTRTIHPRPDLSSADPTERHSSRLYLRPVGRAGILGRNTSRTQGVDMSVVFVGTGRRPRSPVRTIRTWRPRGRRRFGRFGGRFCPRRWSGVRTAGGGVPVPLVRPDRFRATLQTRPSSCNAGGPQRR